MFYLEISSKKKHYGFLLYGPWIQGFHQLYVFAPRIAEKLIINIERDLYIKVEYLKNYIGFKGNLQQLFSRAKLNYQFKKDINSKIFEYVKHCLEMDDETQKSKCIFDKILLENIFRIALITKERNQYQINIDKNTSRLNSIRFRD